MLLRQGSSGNLVAPESREFLDYSTNRRRLQEGLSPPW